MDVNFVDRKTGSMVRAMGIKNTMLPTPTWSEVKQWLWDKNKRYFVTKRYENNFYVHTYGKNDVFPIGDSNYCRSPIEAEIKAIKEAVQYLHSQIKK